MRLKDLKENPLNPRKISESRLKMLEKSLIEFGDLSGIVWNRKTGRLVGAHQRLKVLPEDSEVRIIKEFPGATKSGTVAVGEVAVGGESFNIRIVDWGEERELAAMIAANKHGGTWDFGLLSEGLLTLDHINLDNELLGFEINELENIMTWSPLPDPTDEPDSNEDHDPWQGMPSYENTDKTSIRSIIVHFKREEDIRDFEKTIDQRLTDKTRSIWFPKIEIEKCMNKRYRSKDET